MAGSGRRKPITVRVTYSDTPMAPEQWERAQRMLARMIAQAYAADHPELFGGSSSQATDKEEASS